MKHTNKKGFTIVELVIVIAVIAILAAVLIPTFTNLIKKANISNDTAITKNLNTAAISAQADTFAQAIEAAKEAGYLVAHLNAKANNVFFVWEDETNQFVLYDLEKGKILYSNTAVTGDPDDSWYFVVNTVEDKNGVLAACPNVNVQYLVSDAAILGNVLTAGGEIYVDESLTITSENRIVVNSEVDVVLNFTGSSVSTADVISGIPVEIFKGNVTVNDAVIGAAGDFENVNGTFNTAVGIDGAAKKVVFNNSTITGKGNAIAGPVKVDGPFELEINNSTIFSNQHCVNITSPGAKAVLNNVNVTCGDNGSAHTEAIFASWGASITLNGGTYVSTGSALVYVQGNNQPEAQGYKTVVTINSGNFTFKNLVTFNGNLDCAEFVINGGTFNCETLTWDVLQQYVTAGATVVLNGTSYTK